MILYKDDLIKMSANDTSTWNLLSINSSKPIKI